MATPIAVFALFATQTAEEWLDFGLDLAKIVGLDTDSWRTGDPTLSTYKYVAEALATRDEQDSEFVKAGFLSTSEGDWKTVHAAEVYGVERDEATFATPTVTLTNNGGGYYPISSGDLTVQASTTKKTFHNTDEHVEPGDVLSPGETVTFQLVADEEGSGSNVVADEIDTIVSPTLIDVSVDSSTAATAQDAQSDDALEDECNDTLGALSPNGAPDAYQSTAKNEELTGITSVTRARSTNDSTSGDVTCYVAGPSGALPAPDVAAVDDALRKWALPLCVSLATVSAAEVSVNLTATISGEDIPADFETRIGDALGEYLSATDISGGTGYETVIARSRLDKLIHDTIPGVVTVSITVPATDTTLSEGQVAVAGTVSITEV